MRCLAVCFVVYCRVEILLYQADVVGIFVVDDFRRFTHGAVRCGVSANVPENEACGNGGLRKLWR